MDWLTEYLMTGVVKYNDIPEYHRTKKRRAMDLKNTEYVREMQMMLHDLGYHEVGMFDGIPGPRFFAALEHYKFDMASQ